MEKELLYGRRELVPAIQVPKDLTSVLVLPTMEIKGGLIRCCRCNHQFTKDQVALPNQQYYCPACINLGRVSTLSKFYHVAEPNQFDPAKPILKWQGELSPLQVEAAETVKTKMATHAHHLLWAVTGAGKTEMTYPAIAQALENKERVAIASPRIDVCRELYPRFKRDFDVEIALLYGGMEEPYAYRQLTICTTHQLLRFYHAFDLLIVDEVDAFPYAMNPELLFATKQAIKPDGGLLLMTATPDQRLLQRVRKKELSISYLPLRYHRHLLPEIHPVMVGNWRKRVTKGYLPTSLIAWINRRLNEQREFLFFVPHIADLAGVASVLRRRFKNARFATVHAADPDRATKVMQMRQHGLDFLITTTILERGVTFPAIDLLVLGADDPVFSPAALVQIAGRVGRSPKRPTGNVTFFIGAYAKNVTQAMQQIKLVNQKGRRLQWKTVCYVINGWTGNQVSKPSFYQGTSKYHCFVKPAGRVFKLGRDLIVPVVVELVPTVNCAWTAKVGKNEAPQWSKLPRAINIIRRCMTLCNVISSTVTTVCARFFGLNLPSGQNG